MLNELGDNKRYRLGCVANSTGRSSKCEAVDVSKFRIDLAFYREADTWEEALAQVTDQLPPDLDRDYDFVDWNNA